MKRQQGMVMLFCLVFLALLGLMAVAGLESVLLHERMLGNLRESRYAFAAAEAALAEAETGLAGQCPDAGGDFAAELPENATIWTRTTESGDDWWQSRGHAASYPLTPESPRFTVESWREPAVSPDPENPQLKPLSVPVYYRITARGEGAGATTLQVTGVVVCDGEQMLSRARLAWRRLL